MRSSAEEAFSLLRKWKEDGAALRVSWQEQSGADSNAAESHRFWGTCIELSDSAALVVGDFVTMNIPLEGATFDFEDMRNAPSPSRFVFQNFDSYLSVRTDRFLVGLMSTKTGKPERIIPPDIIQEDEP